MDGLSENVLTRLKTDAEKLCRKGETPGAECALFTRDRILFSYDYGQINTVMGIPSTMESRYMIGSCTKMMTAMCCLKLYEDRKLDIYRDIRTYLPEFSVKTKDARITVKDLLQHRSGLQGDFFGIRREQGMGAILEALRDTELSYEPGAMFSYSNAGYALLGLLIERLVGCSYESYVNQILGNPLGIKIHFRKEELSYFSCAYDKAGREVEDFVSSMAAVSAGTCTYMSMQDFVKFGQVFLNRGAPILREDTFALMESLPVRDPLDHMLVNYGYGLIHNQYHFPRVTVLGHSGDTICHHAVFQYIPEIGVGVAVMTNSSNGLSLAGKLSLMMLRTALKAAGRTAVIPESSTRNPAVPIDLVRTFATSNGPLEIGLDSRGHFGAVLKGIKIRLVPVGDGWVHCTPSPLAPCIPPLRRQIERVYLKPGTYMEKPVLLAVNRCRDYWNMGLLGTPYESSPIPAAFYQAQGVYEPADPEIKEKLPGILKLTEKDGKLLMILDGEAIKAEFLLKPRDYHRAVIQGCGRYAGEEITVNPKENTLNYMGMTFRHLKITK